MNDAFGRPMYMHADYLIEGTPFFSNDYCTARIKLRKGKTYNGIKVKLNLQENLVVYDMGDGKEMAATSAVEKIFFYDCKDSLKSKTFVSGFEPIDQQNENSFYQLLDSGAVLLLKYFQISFRDTKYYGSPNTTRVFEQKEIYYASVPGKGLLPLKKDNASVLAVLSDQQISLRKFMVANDLKCKKEEDLVRVVRYYNKVLGQ